MTKIVLYWPLMLLTSCAWIAANPQADAEIIEVAEELTGDLYRYETGKTLSPGPLPGQPPMKLQGPTGPGK